MELNPGTLEAIGCGMALPDPDGTRSLQFRAMLSFDERWVAKSVPLTASTSVDGSVDRALAGLAQNCRRAKEQATAQPASFLGGPGRFLAISCGGPVRQEQAPDSVTVSSTATVWFAVPR